MRKIWPWKSILFGFMISLLSPVLVLGQQGRRLTHMRLMEAKRDPVQVSTDGMYRPWLDCLAASESALRLPDSDSFLIPSEKPEGFYLVRPGFSEFYGMKELKSKKCFIDAEKSASAPEERRYNFVINDGKRLFETRAFSREGVVGELFPYAQTGANQKEIQELTEKGCLLSGGTTVSEREAGQLLSKWVEGTVKHLKWRYDNRVSSSQYRENEKAPNPENYISVLTLCRKVKDEKVLSAIDEQMNQFLPLVSPWRESSGKPPRPKFVQ